MNPELNDEKKEIESPNTSNEQAKEELKWGNEEIKTKVEDTYLYQDPTATNTQAVESPKVEEIPPVEEVVPVVQTPVVNPVETTNSVVNEVPKVEVESTNTTNVPTTPVVNPVPPTQAPVIDPVLTEEKKVVVPTIPATPNVEQTVAETTTEVTGDGTNQAPPENAKKGKKTGILLFLLFLFLLAFVVFLPNITEFINLQKSKIEQGGTSTPTPTATPTVTPTSTPETELSLAEIAKAFNESEDIKTITNLLIGSVITAEVENNTITVKYEVTGQDMSLTSTYVKEDNILTTTNADSLTGPIMIDTISQLQGNNRGAAAMFFKEDYAIYLLAVDGIELSPNIDSTWKIQVDLSGKMNVVDSGTVAIELEDMEEDVDYLPKGNMLMIRNINEEEAFDTIYLGEKGTFTAATYNSLLTLVEFYLGSEVNNFEDSYPYIISTKTVIGNVSVEEVSEDDENLDAFDRLGNYKVLKVEIVKP